MKRSILAWGVFVALSATSLRADDVKKSPPAKPSLPTGHLRTEDWLTYSTDRLAAGEELDGIGRAVVEEVVPVLRR